MLTIEPAFPNKLHLAWRVVDYLQSDALAKGVRNPSVTSVGSFWNNLDQVMDRSNTLYVATNSRGSVVGYMVIDRLLDVDIYSGCLGLEIFEVLPRYKNKGFGTQMFKWLQDKAVHHGFSSIKIHPANHSEGFWEKLGFSDQLGHGWLLPIA